jgi:DNA ligase-1
VEQRLLPLKGQSPQEQAARLRTAFDELDAQGRFLLIKLIGGGFRVGVSKLLVQRALAQGAGIDPKAVALAPPAQSGRCHTPAVTSLPHARRVRHLAL